uniref:Cobalt-precorrin 5A hydrolase n=1 Tax=Candidatus Kentrum eta TaxID=2126337 RepID=A0A450VRP6_9GAMM|nr:MAG: cobalt-precorrin 5A hydrolase [Candidatus Kentron sp. H]VFK04345.1 MAG: cobalt-precorrin 5A hydrolase [Candidatus Kentron sp. H]VFK07463.1 MAG: cobalt-precorrin 5A hydrolase [Candidatus Kentron sp. H]
MNNDPSLRLASPRLVLVALTRNGALRARQLASRMPRATVMVAGKFRATMDDLTNRVEAYRGPLRGRIAGLFARYDGIVFFLSLGAVVRMIAPHLTSKYRDPAVVAVDDAGQFVIPVVSGHVGGANELARELARWLGATAVVTTASDVNETLSVDILGRELGWRVEASKTTLTRVSAQVVNGEPIAFVREAGSRDWWPTDMPLPGNIRLFERMEDVPLDRFGAVLWVTHRAVDESLARQLSGRLVVYRPSLTQKFGLCPPARQKCPKKRSLLE